jgi:hypothetical protein
MQDEIENCLRPVIAAVAAAPSSRERALEMLRHGSTGFVCEQGSLGGHISNRFG